MDLGIEGRSAIVCAGSAGLGYACAAALAEAGVRIFLNARTADRLEAAAQTLRERYGAHVETIAADVSTAEGRAEILKRCPEPDILINNAGGPPPGDFRDWERDDWIKALDANMLAPIAMMRAVVDSMMERGFGRIVNITSSAVKAPISILGLSNGARSGLTGFVAGLAREIAGSNVTINNLLPGAFDTQRLKATAEATARRTGQSVEEVNQQRIVSIPAKRFGRPPEFGATCAFLCSGHASYITGQNILIDGGDYRGTF